MRLVVLCREHAARCGEGRSKLKRASAYEREKARRKFRPLTALWLRLVRWASGGSGVAGGSSAERDLHSSPTPSPFISTSTSVGTGNAVVGGSSAERVPRSSPAPVTSFSLDGARTLAGEERREKISRREREERPPSVASVSSSVDIGNGLVGSFPAERVPRSSPPFSSASASVGSSSSDSACEYSKSRWGLPRESYGWTSVDVSGEDGDGMTIQNSTTTPRRTRAQTSQVVYSAPMCWYQFEIPA